MKYFLDIDNPVLDRIEGSCVVIYDCDGDCDWKCVFPKALCEKGTDAVMEWLKNNNPEMTLEFEYTDEI